MRKGFVIALLALGACDGGHATSPDAAVPDAAFAFDANDAAVIPIPTYASTPVQMLTAPTGYEGNFGLGLAVSADGTTLAACGSTTMGATALFVYTLGASGFPAAPSQTLAAPSDTFAFCSGWALSADGSTLAVGTSNAAATQAEVLVFARASGTYPAAPSQTVVVPNATTLHSVALSADASTLVASGSSVAVFSRSGTAYGPSPVQTLAPPADATAFFGATDALSGDGSTLLVGDPAGDADTGHIDLYTRGAAGYAPAGSLASPSNVDAFGSSFSLRADGQELVESGDSPAHITVYARSATGFVNEQDLASPPGAPGNFLPTSALAADGRLFVGGNGTLYVYAAP